MGSKIYVGGLPYSTTEQEPSDLIAAHGAVIWSRSISVKCPGQSPGLEFVALSPDSQPAADMPQLSRPYLARRELHELRQI